MNDTPRSFASTLEPRNRRLAGRLEGFGDIVFGFAVSQCALQLPTDHGHVDLSHPLGVLSYFGTFAIIVSLWLIFHRLMSGTFLPTGVDLFLAFAYLALVSLIPYAMYALSHQAASAYAAKVAFAQYAVLYAATTALAAVLTLRNLRRGWFYADAGERGRGWLTFIRQVAFSALMCLGCAIDLGFGPAAGGCSLFAIPVVFRIVRARCSRAPSAAALRISAAAGRE